jgi:hypothetical protein
VGFRNGVRASIRGVGRLRMKDTEDLLRFLVLAALAEGLAWKFVGCLSHVVDIASR